MNIISSYKVNILSKVNFKSTVEIYRKALAYLINVYNVEWDTLKSFVGINERFNYAEHLVHNTKNNIAKYSEFDDKFYKFPSYLRRAAVSNALGTVSSYRSNLKNWEKNGKIGKAPRLVSDKKDMPVFYKGDSYKPGDNRTEAKLKLFINNDWRWITVRLRHTDVRYLEKYWTGVKACAPVLEKRYGKYYLRFAFEEKVSLSSIEIKDQLICAVDLGINTDAVCSIMNSSGTVLARKFISFPSEKDQLNHIVNRIKKHQRKYGSNSVCNFWAYAQRLNTEHANKIAAAIVEFAAINKVDCIVFEHLDMQGKKRGKIKQKLALWRKNTVQNVATHKAHRAGMHVSHICAWNTSKLAFDGSGKVERNDKNYSLCTFSNGKQYNCDLNASYNIGSRYFIRELLKPLPVTERSLLLAKVPNLERRTSNTLATLKLLSSELNKNLPKVA